MTDHDPASPLSRGTGTARRIFGFAIALLILLLLLWVLFFPRTRGDEPEPHNDRTVVPTPP
jgi:hypothetical protein